MILRIPISREEINDIVTTSDLVFIWNTQGIHEYMRVHYGATYTTTASLQARRRLAGPLNASMGPRSGKYIFGAGMGGLEICPGLVQSAMGISHNFVSALVQIIQLYLMASGGEPG